MLRRKNFHTLPAVLLLAFGSLAGAQTPQPPTLPGTISTVSIGSYSLSIPSGLVVDSQNNLYISDTAHIDPTSHAPQARILKVDGKTGQVSVYAGGGTGGDNSPAASAALGIPQQLAVDASGNLYIADSLNNNIREVNASTGIITTVASGFATPTGVAYDKANNVLYVADSNTIKTVQNGTVASFSAAAAINNPSNLAFANGTLFWVNYAQGHAGQGSVQSVNVTTGAVETFASGLSQPWGVAVDSAGDVYYSLYGDKSTAPPTGGQVFMVTAPGNSPVPVAGSGAFGYTGDGGSATSAALADSVTGLAIGPDGSLYIDDGHNNVVRKVTFPAPANTGGGGSSGGSGGGNGGTGGGGTPTPPTYNVPGCTAISFSASPNPIYTNESYGITNILANVTCAYDIRLNSPNGPLFATGNGYSSKLTGPWVSDGTTFYLQQSGNTTAQGTIAPPITVHVTPGYPGRACIATAFTASPNPIITSNTYGQTTITAVTNCQFDIHVNTPDGPLFVSGRGLTTKATGAWITNGTALYLQPAGDTNASDTLATLKLVVQTPPAGCTVNNFSANPNPIATTNRLNQVTVNVDATCSYDVRIQGPNGQLFGSGSGQGQFTTGTWVSNGMSFFLQKSGDNTAAGTLATFSVTTKLPDNVGVNCPVTAFNATPNPIIAAGGTGSTTVNVNASCQWDLRQDDSNGTLLTTGSGAGSVAANNIANNTRFFLQPHNDTYFGDTIAILNATVTPQAPSGCTALVFSASVVQTDDVNGVSVITADATCPYDVRIDSPDGPLFRSGNGFTTGPTGTWVAFGQQFYLQKQGDTTSAGTLAVQYAVVLP